MQQYIERFSGAKENKIHANELIRHKFATRHIKSTLQSPPKKNIWCVCVFLLLYLPTSKCNEKKIHILHFHYCAHKIFNFFFLADMNEMEAVEKDSKKRAEESRRKKATHNLKKKLQLHYMERRRITKMFIHLFFRNP